MPTAIAGPQGLNMNDLDVGQLVLGTVTDENSTTYIDANAGQVTTFTGVGFTYDAFGYPTGGTVTGVEDSFQGQPLYEVTGASNPVTTWEAWANNDDTASALKGVFGGADTLEGAIGNDTLNAYSGDDSVSGGGGDDLLNGGGPGLSGAAATGSDTLSGGTGNDTVVATDGHNYLRGDDGDDSIQGGAGFDDINGNKGNDTIAGDQTVGSDWLVGGQNNDSITGYAGQNLIYGNLGNDTLHGGKGGDVVRGGQGDDIIVGGSGNDFISGDRGNDTESGGAGADNFHDSQDAGIDRVLDFNLAQGDRVELDPGTTYTVSQVGADTVIDMGGGNQMILVGVQMSMLTGNWIFEG